MNGRRVAIVSGMIAGDPLQGGASWAVAQYALGLRRLGYDAFVMEPVKDCERLQSSAPYFQLAIEQLGLAGRAAMLVEGSRETIGLSYDEMLAAAGRADLLFNVSGMLTDHTILEKIPRRVYLDLDPAFVQLWRAVQGIDMRFDAHTHFVTVGLRIGSPDCVIPSCGKTWVPTLPPVVLEHWPVAKELRHDALTTIGNWRGYGSIDHDGHFYGQKAHSWRPLMSLPTRVAKPFMPALAIHEGEVRDLEMLHQNGWRLLDPKSYAGTPNLYRNFVQSSWGEFGIAKSGYVESRCGWFSDRSACYLASGRPVIAQDTGFGATLPTGTGLLSFRTLDEAVAAVEEIRRGYTEHARAARELAVEYFDSDKVLSRLLDRLGG